MFLFSLPTHPTPHVVVYFVLRSSGQYCIIPCSHASHHGSNGVHERCHHSAQWCRLQTLPNEESPSLPRYTDNLCNKWAGNDHQLQFANAMNIHKEQTVKSSQNIFCLILFSRFTFCLTTQSVDLRSSSLATRHSPNKFASALAAQSVRSPCLTPLLAMPAVYAFSALPFWQHISVCRKLLPFSYCHSY